MSRSAQTGKRTSLPISPSGDSQRVAHRNRKRFRHLLYEHLEDRRLLSTNETEPNGTAATATTFVTPSDHLVGQVADASDVDFFKVTLTQGDRLLLRPDTNLPMPPVQFRPSVEVLGPDGSQLFSQSRDGRGISTIVPASGTYYVKLTASHSVGTFTGSYDDPVEVTAFTGVTESEPNDTAGAADPIASIQNIRGTLATVSDADFFSFTASAGNAVGIKLANLPGSAPSVRVYDPTQNLIAEDRSGVGLHVRLTAAGQYSIKLSGDNTAGTFSGQYVAAVIVTTSATVERETNGLFSDATSWSVTSATSYAVGTLSAAADVDFFAVDFAPATYYRFGLQSPTGQLGAQQRVISLYNEFGQLLQYSTYGILLTASGGVPNEGRHYVAVEAADGMGLGGYALWGRVYSQFPAQRDVPLFFQDYTCQEPHLGNQWLEPFDRPDAVGLILGVFDALYDSYEVDVTLSNPSDTTEHVAIGIGEFDRPGSVGVGNAGNRRPTGDAFDNNYSQWGDSLYDLSQYSAVNHELGHGVSLAHTRHPLDVMSYDHQTNAIPVGASFEQSGLDSRLPFIKIQNDREWLDWILQAGRFGVDSEPNGDLGSAQNVDPFFAEMATDADERNNKVIVVGLVDVDDADFFSFTAGAHERFRFDLESAEFQKSLDAMLEIYDGAGTLLAKNRGGLDLESGLNSVDPFLEYEFASAGTYYVAVRGEFSTFGSYRLKVVPVTSLDSDAPRIIAVWPDGGSPVDGTRQLTFWTDNQLDPASLAGNVIVAGNATGVRTGTATLDPMDSTLVWRADQPLPPDSYTVTLRSGATGIRDLDGNPLDGETDGAMSFPEVSGNGAAGGDFVSSFSVSSADTTPAAITTTTYRRHGANRGQITLSFDDELDAVNAPQAALSLRGAGPDGLLDTPDDTYSPLDILYDKIDGTEHPTLQVYTRGIPDAYPTVAPPPVATGSFPRCVVSADLNGDSQTDLVVANFFSGNVTALLGQGSGRFATAGSYATGSRASALATGDFNNDGKQDVVVVNNGDNTISVLLGKGDGTFNTPTNYPTGRNPVDVSTGDFNNDGRLDFAVVNCVDNTVDIFIGNGDGSLQASTSYPNGGSWATAVTTGDLNGDFRLDLVITNSASSRVSVLLGNGNGTFQAASTYASGLSPADVEVGDLNGDGKMDVVTANATSNNVSIFLGQGDGTLAAAVNYATGASPNSVKLGDLNDDGKKDIVAADQKSNTVSVLLGLGDGTFLSRTSYATVDSPRDSTLADFNADGHLDVAVTSQTGGVVGFLIGKSDGTLIEYSGNYRLEGQVLDAVGNTIAISARIAVTDDPVLTHGPSVVELSIRPNTVVTAPVKSLDVTFSGRLDLNSLTPQNLTLRYSPDAEFFDNDDVLISDADNRIQWDATRNRATFAAASNLQNGYYLLEINGRPGGITDSAGRLLDGEYLASNIPGNTDSSVWDGGPSGDGIPGGDFRVFFVVANPAIQVTIASTSISENGGTSTATVQRNVADMSPTLTVNLSSSDTTEATVPTSVTIPANQASASFVITAVDDAIVDGTQTVTITASATGFASGSDTLQVTDNETVALTVHVVAASVAENAGAAATTVTIGRSADTSAALTVNLSSSDVSEATVPATATIPAGQSSVTVNLAAVDDAIADGTQTVTIRASAVGFTSGSDTLQVTDNETPALTVDVAAASVPENAGSAATTVTISRSTDTSAALTVNLASSDASEATIPATATIPAGQSSVTVNLAAVDDAFEDGTQTVTITASAAGFASGSDTLQVTDNDGVAALTVNVLEAYVLENAGAEATIVTISRNTDTSTALTVNLSSSDVTEATVPATATILAGQWSATVYLAAVDDAIVDSTQTVTITASAAGFASGSDTLQVIDNDVGTLTVIVVAVSVGENAGSAATTVTVSRNTDTTSELTVSLSSSDASEATVPATAIIAAGQSSVTVDLAAVDDAIVDGIQTVTITASAPGFVNGTYTLQVTDNDTPALTVDVAATAVAENAGAAATTVTISRNTSTSTALTVNLSSSDASEASVPATATIPAGQSSVTVNLAAVDDAMMDGTQMVTITASAAGFASGSDTLQVTDSDAPALTVDVATASVAENAGSAATTVTIRRNTDTSAAVTVNLSSSDASEATVPATATIAVGQSSVTVNLAAVDDAIVDGIQTVTITASANGFASGSDTLQVTDNETPTLTVNVAAASVAEHAGSAATAVTISRNTDTSVALTVNLSSSDASEATVPATATILAGQASVTVNLAAVDDGVFDGTQAVTITASATGYASGTKTLDVTDDDWPGFVISPSGGLVTTESGGQAVFTVRLTTQPSADVSVGLSSSDIGEGRVTPASLTFTATNWNVAQMVTVTGVDDARADGDTAYSIDFALAVSIDGNYNGINPQDVSVTNEDNDTPGVSIVESDASTPLTEGGATDTYTLVLTSQPAAKVVITVIPDSQVRVSPTSLTFNVANWSVAQTVTVTAVDDAVAEGAHAGIIGHRVGSSDTSYEGFAVGSVTAWITDNDEAGFVVSPVGGLLTTEEGGQSMFAVNLTSQPTADVSIGLISGDTSEGTVAPASLTFTAAEWNVAQTVTVTGVDDSQPDGDVAYTIFTAPAVSIDGNYDNLDPPDVSVTNADNDLPPEVTTSVPSTTGPTNASSLTFTVTFTHLVSNVDETDFQLSETGTASGMIASVTPGSGTSFTVTVSGLTGDGTMRLDLKGGTDVQNGAGNVAPAFSTGSVVTLDHTAPTASITAVMPDIRNAPAGVATVIFGEAVMDVALTDFRLTRNGTAVSLAGLALTTVSESEYALDLSTVSVPPGAYVLTLVADGSDVEDAAGNPLVGDASTAFVVRPWQNVRNVYDVNNDSDVTPSDVLAVINEINSRGAGPISLPGGKPPFVDVNGDGHITAGDVLLVINYLNGHAAGEGESAAVQSLVLWPETPGSGASVPTVGSLETTAAGSSGRPPAVSGRLSAAMATPRAADHVTVPVLVSESDADVFERREHTLDADAVDCVFEHEGGWLTSLP